MKYEKAYSKAAEEAKEDYFLMGIQRTEKEVINNALKLCNK